MNLKLRSFLVSLSNNIVLIVAILALTGCAPKKKPTTVVESAATNASLPSLSPSYYDPTDTNTVAGALLPAVPPTNSVPAAVSAPVAPTNATASVTLTQADLAALTDLIKEAIANQPPVQVTVTNSPAGGTTQQVAAVTLTDTNRFVRGAQTNRIVVDASWKTSFGDGEYKETRTIEAGTAGAQQTVLDVPTVAQLVGALKEAQLAANASSPAATPAKVAGVATVTTPQTTNQVAQGNPAQPDPTATTPVELENPTFLRKDGRIVQLQGQWLYTIDGKAVFVPEPEPEPVVPPRAIPATTRPEKTGTPPGYVAYEVAGKRFYRVSSNPR